MLAIAAAVAFGLAILFDLTDASLGDSITGGTLVTVGLLLIALHLAGFGTGARAGAGGRSWSWRRARR
ncbi:hypothetical protein NLM24_30040 [Nocardia zapadnayensis]|uniref:hypothetical protein n=1 Tax=Nocardia rhamnosiphila TaxID=426716 RepID=UPI00224875B0|nr:hypothetical protein [Nocardia zapadnayensis]MCX0274863.1 hypothetical protein [Nocardia zapadnayensis]